jgi:valyl-tRNA synthetase
MSSQDQTRTEDQWYKFWEEQGLFSANPDSERKAYSLLMPPPNLTGEPHLGHAMQHAILDAIARFKRMQGFDVLLLPGVDHAGIQFESTLNKQLSKDGLHKGNMSREDWLKRAWQFKDEVYNAVHKTWTFLGISADWSREVFTLEPKVQKAVLEEFKTFFEQGLLYKGAYIVQWCPKDQTAIEDVEMEYEEKKEKLLSINYKIENSEENITIATARPETIAADVAVAIYPNHPKYSHLVGKFALNPFTNSLIPIIEDERVEREFGTGALKITPGHDLLDYEIGKDHALPILHVVDKTGRITELDPNLSGLKILEARQRAVEILSEKGQIENEEEYSHSVPVCERCKTTVEPLISEEFFVKMKPLSEKALQKIGDVNFIPKNYQKILDDWMENIHDWSISRNLWWGHRIPVWYCDSCNKAKELGVGKGIFISFDEPSSNCTVCGAKQWVQEEKVLDTWFSSGLWPLATLGWPESTKEFSKYFPWSFELSAPEIKYLWIARMVMLSLHFSNKIPFENMFFHGTLRALDGQKFSKSLGNGIDPMLLRENWGTDAVRMTLYSYSAPGRDGRTSLQLMDQRAKNFRNFITKIRNITKFIVDLKPEGSLSADGKPAVVHQDDKQIMEQFETTINEVTKNLEEFNLHLATEAIYEFLWHQFADIYIEKSKERRGEAQPVLEYILKESLKLLHPFMPFTTEELYQKLPHEEKSIMVSQWPSS